MEVVYETVPAPPAGPTCSRCPAIAEETGYDVYVVGVDAEGNAMAIAQRMDVATNNTAGTSARAAPTLAPGYPRGTVFGGAYIYVSVVVRPRAAAPQAREKIEKECIVRR